MLTKQIKRSEDLYITFSEKELSELGLTTGDKLSWQILGDSVILKKFATIDIDISEWSREVLEMLIIKSVETDLSVNDVICECLEDMLRENSDSHEQN